METTVETTGTATYSPEDNKLRLYPFSRLDAATYEQVKSNGFKWAPKQELFVSPMWTPTREDFLLELCSEIEDEDKSLTERAEERADRMTDYAGKRANEAEQARESVNKIMDGIPMGQPILVGHHSEKHARRDRDKIENGMRKSIKLWEQSKYWKERAHGAIRHAKYKERADVRARRIKTLEADQRKWQRSKKEAETWLHLWERVLDDEKPIITKKDGTQTTALERANWIANRCDLHIKREDDTSRYWSAWDVLRPDGERYKACPAMTVEQVQAVALKGYPATIAHCDRWINHIENRLTYERTMLEAEGGTVTDKKGPEKGGAVKCWASPRNGWSYIQKVNKVSITVWDNWGNGGKDFTRTIPFDKIKKIMTAAEVQTAKDAGMLLEISDPPSRGFVLREDVDHIPRQAQPTDTAPTTFDKMKETLKEGVKVVVANQLFPTPPDLARRMVEEAEIEEGQKVLEPSAGTGSIVKAISDAYPSAQIHAIEVNATLAEALSRLFGYPETQRPGYNATCADFLTCNGNLGQFDKILMNPPFENASDIKHIQHALTFLKPGGRLVAICANGPRHNEKLKPLASSWEELPADTFKEQGTRVNTVLAIFDKEEEKKPDAQGIDVFGEW